MRNTGLVPQSEAAPLAAELAARQGAAHRLFDVNAPAGE